MIFILSVENILKADNYLNSRGFCLSSYISCKRFCDYCLTISAENSDRRVNG